MKSEGEINMALIDELKARKVELLKQTEAIDREAAKVREQYEEKLADLRNKAAGNNKFEDLLNEVLQSTEKLTQLSKEVGGNKSPQ